MFCRTRSLLFSVRCSTFLRSTKLWLKWSSKAEVQQWDMYPEPTELLLTGGFFIELIWIPKFTSSQAPTCRHVDKREFQTRWVEQSSLSVWHQAFQLSLLLSEFQLDQLHRNDGEKDARTGRREQDLGKVKANDEEPGRLCLDKFFNCEESDCVEEPEDTLKAFCRTDWSSSGNFDARNANHDAASSSQGWQKDALLELFTVKPVATEEDPEHLNYPEASVHKGKLVAPGYPGIPGDSGDSETEGNDEYWPHNLHISSNYVHHMEKVSSIVSRSPTDQMKDLDVNTAFWDFFMSVTLQAAVHLGKDYTENLRSTENQPKKSLRQLFQVTERLITDQTKNTGLTTNDWQHPVWRETTLITDRAVHV